MDPKSLFSLIDHLEALSRDGDPLEVLQRTVDFEYFRGWLIEGLGYGDGAKGGRPPFDPVMMFKALILQAQHNLSDARMEFMIRDRLSWLRFLELSHGDRTPDENTIRHFRNRLTETGTLKRVMKAFDWQLQKKGYIPMSGQTVDASLVPAPKQRNTDLQGAAPSAAQDRTPRRHGVCGPSGFPCPAPVEAVQCGPPRTRSVDFHGDAFGGGTRRSLVRIERGHHDLDGSC